MSERQNEEAKVRATKLVFAFDIFVLFFVAHVSSMFSTINKYQRIEFRHCRHVLNSVGNPPISRKRETILKRQMEVVLTTFMHRMAWHGAVCCIYCTNHQRMWQCALE